MTPDQRHARIAALQLELEALIRPHAGGDIGLLLVITEVRGRNATAYQTIVTCNIADHSVQPLLIAALRQVDEQPGSIRR